MRSGGAAFRRAVAASVGLHALLAVAVVVGVRWHASRPVAAVPQAAIDTRADLQITFAPDDASPPVEVTAPEPASRERERPEQVPPVAHAPGSPSPAPVAHAPGSPEQEPESTAESRPPLVRVPSVPQTLPPELLALVKRPPAPPSDVVEVAVHTTPLHPQPAAAPTPAVRPVAATRADGGRAIHGALAAGQTIVYVLDSSGSMGEGGKFDTARRALVASLRGQPESVRFQVVVYAGTARAVLPGGCVPATPENVARATDALLALPDPAGVSRHAKGVGSALGFRPDIVLILTDADELPAASLRGVRREATKAVVCVAKVGANGVGKPREVK